MAQVHAQIQSFNAGELSPLLGARFGVEKVASGCRRLRNFLLHVHGPVFRRPGMQFMGAAADHGEFSDVYPTFGPSRLHGFNFSTTTSAVLELHPTGLRVWSNGLPVPLLFPVPLPYSSAECFGVQIVQVADVCYLTHPNYAPRKLVRYADDNWGISAVRWKWPAMGNPSAELTDLPPAITVLLTVPAPLESATFTATDTTITFSANNPDLSSAVKVAKLKVVYGDNESTQKTLTWTTIAPAAATLGFAGAQTFRMTYDGPASPSGGNIRSQWAAGSSVLLTDDLNPANEVEVAVGEWQAVALCPAIVAGSTLLLENWNGAAWVLLNTFTLVSGATITYRGATLGSATRIRFRWTGPFATNGGSGRIEQLVFSDELNVTLAVSAATVGIGRTMTASAPIFQPGHVGSFWQITHRRATASVAINEAGAITAATTAPLRVNGGWQVLTYGTWTATLFLERKIGSGWEIVRSWESRGDRNLAVDGTEDGVSEIRLRITSGTSTVDPRFVLEAVDSESSGLVKVTAIGALAANGKSLTATVDVISALDATTATLLWQEGAWSTVRGYPRSVAIHGERLWFGGTAAEPMRLWGSVVADYEDFRISTLDDAGLSFTPAAMQNNAIQWMLSHEKELIIGTSGDEWTLSAENGPLTPVNFSMQRRSRYGSEFQQAHLLNEVVVFVQRGSRKLRQIAPRAETEAWAANDLTVLAEHVTAEGVVQFAVMTAPFSILWAVTGDGKLLGMTFEQEQNVFGWHVHETSGEVESVAVIRGEDQDEVWLCVRRGEFRNIERMDPTVFARNFETPNRMIYLDAATRFEDPDFHPDFPGPYIPAGPELTGLFHLEGRTVSIIADGAELTPQVVVGGAVTMDDVAAVAIVGLPFTSELQPMRLEVPMRDGTAQGRMFRVSRVYVTVQDSLGGEVADGLDGRFEEINYRETAHLMDAIPPLLSGEFETAIQSTVRRGIDVVIRQRSAKPLNIGSIVVKGDVYGE